MGSLLFLGLGQPKPLNSKVLPDQRAIKGFPSSESCVSNRINPELKDTTIYNLGHSLALKFASTNDPFLYKPELENDKETCNYSQMGSFVQDNRGEGTFERILWICLWANDGIKEKMVFFFLSLSLLKHLTRLRSFFIHNQRVSNVFTLYVCVQGGRGGSVHKHMHFNMLSANSLMVFVRSVCIRYLQGGRWKEVIKTWLPRPKLLTGKRGRWGRRERRREGGSRRKKRGT